MTDELRLHILQAMCNGDKRDAKIMLHLSRVFTFEFPYERVQNEAAFLGLETCRA